MSGFSESWLASKSFLLLGLSGARSRLPYRGFIRSSHTCSALSPVPRHEPRYHRSPRSRIVDAHRVGWVRAKSPACIFDIVVSVQGLEKWIRIRPRFFKGLYRVTVDGSISQDEIFEFLPAERGVIPGAPPTPAHSPRVCAIYGVTSVLVGLTGALGNGLLNCKFAILARGTSTQLNSTHAKWLGSRHRT